MGTTFGESGAAIVSERVRVGKASVIIGMCGKVMYLSSLESKAPIGNVAGRGSHVLGSSGRDIARKARPGMRETCGVRVPLASCLRRLVAQEKANQENDSRIKKLVLTCKRKYRGLAESKDCFAIKCAHLLAE